VPDSVVNIGSLRTWLKQRDERYQIALGDGSGLQITINKRFIDSASVINDGDEISFFQKHVES